MKDLLEEERNRWLVRFVEEIPALHTAIDGTSGLVGLLHRVRDEWIIWRGRHLHLEVLDGTEPRGTVVFHHGYGAYARLYLPTLGLLAEEGFNVVALDRPGHGLSDGRRGDCTVEELADVTRAVFESVRSWAQEPFILMGSSAGGILAACLLPYFDDTVSAGVCHNFLDPRWLRVGVPGRMIRRAAEGLPRLTFPYRLIPASIRRGISAYPIVREWWKPGADPHAAFGQTLRSVLSMTVGYDPPHPFSRVQIPVLVMCGERDGMVPSSRTSESFRKARLLRGELRVIEGAGHMLMHERPTEFVGQAARWLETVLR